MEPGRAQAARHHGPQRNRRVVARTDRRPPVLRLPSAVATFRPMPPFALLALAIASEIVATLALRASAGFTRIVPSVVVVVGYATAFWLLALVLKSIPVSVAYAVWSAVGTALIAAIGMVVFGEPSGPVRLASLALIIVGVVGLNLGGGAAR